MNDRLWCDNRKLLILKLKGKILDELIIKKKIAKLYFHKFIEKYVF